MYVVCFHFVLLKMKNELCSRQLDVHIWSVFIIIQECFVICLEQDQSVSLLSLQMGLEGSANDSDIQVHFNYLNRNWQFISRTKTYFFIYDYIIQKWPKVYWAYLYSIGFECLFRLDLIQSNHSKSEVHDT